MNDCPVICFFLDSFWIIRPHFRFPDVSVLFEVTHTCSLRVFYCVEVLRGRQGWREAGRVKGEEEAARRGRKA
ncbi:hypothetical protein E2C01_011438 [Portunus trituberculatus]|uniref:Uncharacterized protein n=1 Tax=Portunus trituberculatus TaxID=210409 RepID=A0A5B7DB67_PORTR|nr:hypothetical protein [Portunus trituberculatus]